MGQFYDTTAGRFVDDKMFQAPYQLAQAVIGNKDKAIDTEIASAVSLYDKLSADVLQQDNPRAKEIVAGYESKINDIVTNIQKNPLEFSKYGRDIRGMGRAINKDWNMGEIHTMQTNKKKLVDYYNELDDLHKKDPNQFDGTYITSMKANALKNYQEGAGYNVNRGIATNNINVDNATALPNLFETFSKAADKMTADGYKIEKASKGDGYIYKVGNETKELTKQKLLEAFSSWAQGQDGANAAIQQRKSLGLAGFEDADVNNIIKYGKDAKGNTIVNPSDNYYGRNAEAIANTFFSKNTTHEEDINSDATWLANRARADKKEEDAYETVDTSFDRVYTTDAGSLPAFRTALDKTNTALVSVKTEAGQMAQQLGIKPGSQAYNEVQNGNFAVLAARGATKEWIDEKTSQYRQNSARKVVLDAQMISFADYAKKNKLQNADKIGTLGWSNDKRLSESYKKYIEDSNIKKETDVNLKLTFNGMNMNKALHKEYRDTFMQNADNLVYKVEGTAKGGEEVRERMDGTKIVYTNDPKKANQFKNYKDKGGKTLYSARYYYVPDGQLTVGRMVQDGVLTKEITQKQSASGDDEEEQTVYQGFSGGKKVGFTIDEKTLGLVSGYDDSGKANLGAKVIFGNNSGTLTFDAKQLNSPTLRQGIQDRQEDFEFDLLDNQTNWKALNVSKNIEGNVYSVKNGKAYIDGRAVGSAADTRAVKMIVLGYYSKQ